MLDRKNIVISNEAEVRDKVTPILHIVTVANASITVTLDGAVVSPDGYTYENGVLTIPSGAAQLTLPAATTETEADGSVTVIPSISTITVTGIITNS